MMEVETDPLEGSSYDLAITVKAEIKEEEDEENYNSIRKQNKRVTLKQLEILWDFFNTNKDLANASNRSIQAKEHSQNKWRTIAEILNSRIDGAHKDWMGWCKYWVDYKAKLKVRYASAKSSCSWNEESHSSERPLSGLEEKFLQLIGDSPPLPPASENSVEPSSSTRIVVDVDIPNPSDPNFPHPAPNPTYAIPSNNDPITFESSLNPLPTIEIPLNRSPKLSPLHSPLAPTPEASSPSEAVLLKRRRRKRDPVSQESNRRATVSQETTRRAPLSRESIRRALISRESIRRAILSQVSARRARLSQESTRRSPVSQESTRRAPVSKESTRRALIRSYQMRADATLRSCVAMEKMTNAMDELQNTVTRIERALLELAQCVQTNQEPIEFNSTDAMLDPKTGHMVCLHCLEDFDTNCLSDHMITIHHYRRVLFKCDVCLTTFQEKKLLTIHRVDCQPEQKSKKRKSFQQILKEVESKYCMNSEDLLEPVSCPICLLDLPKYCLKEHLLNEHRKPDVILTCGRCNRNFKSKLTLREHVKLVHEAVEDSEECNLCGQKFRSVKYLSNHKRNVHPSGNKIHKCEVCGKEFKSRLCLHQHTKYVHPPESASVECPHCPKKIFKSRMNLQQHLKISHGWKKKN